MSHVRCQSKASLRGISSHDLVPMVTPSPFSGSGTLFSLSFHPLQVHRALMLITSFLTCIAFVLPFIYRGGWSSVSTSYTGWFHLNSLERQRRLLFYSQMMGKQIFLCVGDTPATSLDTLLVSLTLSSPVFKSGLFITKRGA